MISGEKMSESIKIGVYDQDEQLVNIDERSEGQIITEGDIIIDGSNKQTAKGGIYEFSSLSMTAQPNYTTNMILVSTALDKKKIELVLKEPFKGNYEVITALDLNLSLTFRECVLGEVVKNNKCTKCLRGFYSFNPKTNHCQKCFQHGICEGGAIIGLESGYWRRNQTTTQVYQCPIRSSCLGGQSSLCATGYTGPMCNLCTDQTINGRIYGRIGAYSCV